MGEQRRHMRHQAGMLAWVVGLSAAGCTAPHGPRAVTNPDPVQKIPAIQDAVRRHDLSVTPQLVKDLDNEDPAIRFYAFEALRKLSGQDFGYRYYDDTDERRPAVDRWRAWLKNR